MTTLDEVADLAANEHDLAVVSTLRADSTIQASVVNAGVLAHPQTGLQAQGVLPAVGAGSGLTSSLVADVADGRIERSLRAASSGGKEPRALVTLRSWKLIDSITFAVQMTLRISGAKARNGVNPSQARFAGMSPAMTVEGVTTAAVSASHLQRVLLPALRPGQLEVFS